MTMGRFSSLGLRNRFMSGWSSANERWPIVRASQTLHDDGTWDKF